MSVKCRSRRRDFATDYTVTVKFINGETPKERWAEEKKMQRLVKKKNRK